MPLVALTAFYCLERLSKEARDQEDLLPATSPAAIHAEDAASDSDAQAPAPDADAR